MDIHTLSPQQLQQWQLEKRNFVLLDVREDNEVQFAALPDHTHIAMNLIPLRHNELPDDQPIVVYCHHASAACRWPCIWHKQGLMTCII